MSNFGDIIPPTQKPSIPILSEDSEYGKVEIPVNILHSLLTYAWAHRRGLLMMFAYREADEVKEMVEKSNKILEDAEKGQVL